MKTRHLFGTDGIRGMANQEPMTPETVLRLGQAVGVHFGRKGTKGHMANILVGRDPRISGFMLERAFVGGVLSTGATVWEVGVIPTPGLCYLTRYLKADVGVMISASHNPGEDNGIKVFGRAGYKLKDREEARLELLLGSGDLTKNRPVGDRIGVALDMRSRRTAYLDFLNASIPPSTSWPGWSMVVDGANGAVSEFVRPLLSMRGAKVIAIGCRPDGMNINDRCGALYPDVVAKRVRQEKADLGICFDGDGDRVLFCDERGQLFDGDDLLALCADEWLETRRLRPKVVVGTVMSNFALEQYLRARGVTFIRSRVGDRYVLERMQSRGAIIGGEPSGHTIFIPPHTTGDGMLTALQVLTIMSTRGRPVSQTARMIHRFPQYHTKVRIRGPRRHSLNGMPGVKKVVADAQSQLSQDGGGRVVVRPSGTEPVIRVMVEASTLAAARLVAQPIVNTLVAGRRRRTSRHAGAGRDSRQGG